MQVINSMLTCVQLPLTFVEASHMQHFYIDFFVSGAAGAICTTQLACRVLTLWPLLPAEAPAAVL